MGAIARGLGNPRIETNIQTALLLGSFDSLLRWFREFRIGEAITEDNKDKLSDEVDAFIEKIETKVALDGKEQKLLFLLVFNFEAVATDDFDLHVKLFLPEEEYRSSIVFVDYVDVISLFSDLAEFFG